MFIACIVNMQARALDRNERKDHLKYLFFFTFCIFMTAVWSNAWFAIYDASFHKVYVAEIVKLARLTKFFRDT